ncbi:MAG TPA: succinate dehydrogenase flavoprotein subunit [Egibacteraceae bacterium]|nr:succinate dehydrogenase flavoprotein subunit [Egibacteraceae bacterium]
MIHQHTFDVVIVGAGGAGLRAAIESAGQVRTAVITKLYPTRSHTGAAQGGMCAALGNLEEDKWEWHSFDTVKGSDYLADQDAVDIMCREAVDAVIELEHMGLPFSRNEDGTIAQRPFGGHTRNHGEAPVRRACYAADRTGHMILQTLYQQCVKRDVQFFDEFYVLDFLTSPDGAQTAGVVAYELKTGDLHVFRAKSVVFATGGYGRMFKVSSNAHALTGDGPAVLYRRGFPLEDMEFFQFHPTGIYRLGILLSEAARGEGGILRNADGERFMERYAPTIKDLAPRDMVSRAMHSEIREGRGIDGKDYLLLDLTHLDREILDSKLPDITEFARTYLNVEPATEGVPIQPTAHYAMGGIPTDNDAQVRVGPVEVFPGLFAAGEAACVSVHGANRLGTNSLLDIVVFGRRAGANAVRHARQSTHADLPEAPEATVAPMLDALVSNTEGERAAVLRSELQESMNDNAMVVRTADGLKEQVQILADLRRRFAGVVVEDKGKVYNTDLLETVELGHLLDLSEALVEGALVRTESRGGHYRDDYPKRDDGNFLKHSLVRRESDGSRSLDWRPVRLGRYEPKERTY